MVRSAPTFFAALIFCAAISAPSGAEFSECSEAAEYQYADSFYVSMVCDAERQLANNDLATARTSLLRALSVRRHEVQTYIPVIKLAEVECLAGERVTGISLINEFDCMLDVDTGVRQCFSGDDPFGHGPTPRDVTPLCFLRMCDEIYRSYYLDIPDARIAHIERLREEARRVRTVCR